MGAASRDLDRARERGWRLGGTVTYSSLAAARLGLQVRALMGVDRDARAAHELTTLRAAGVEVELFDLESGPVFENVVRGEGRVQIARGSSNRIPAQALPTSWRHTDAVLLGPVADELGGDWAEAFDRGVTVALAWQGLLRELREARPVRLKPLRRNAQVARANVLFVSAEDAAAGGAPLDELLRDGQELFVTHGGHGALHLRRASGRVGGRYVPARPRRSALDTTGAGDVFMAAYLAARLAAPDLAETPERWRLNVVAAGAASLSVAARDLEGVPTLRELCSVLVKPQR